METLIHPTLWFMTLCLTLVRKSLTLKYYAKKILYFLRQQNILRALKTFLEQPAELQSALEGEAPALGPSEGFAVSTNTFPSPGAVLVDRYCNPLADVTLDSISAQLDEITDKVRRMLRVRNPSHPSLRLAEGGLRGDTVPVNSLLLADCVFLCVNSGQPCVVEDLELQRQLVFSLNSVLYEQLQYKGNEFDYYNPLNSYIHQVGPLDSPGSSAGLRF